jgi:uncharacterized protein YbcI
MTRPPPQREPGGEVLSQISTEMAELYEDHFGKRPGEAKTYAHDDVVVCVLRDSLTTVETTLSTNGHRSTVHNVRAAFQEAVADGFKGIVERSTNRRVIAFMSQAHIDPDLTIEIFFLGNKAPGERASEMRSGEASG